MSRYTLSAVGVLSLLALAACADQTTQPTFAKADQQPAFGQGNGMPSGSHYNLNLIGVQNDKQAAMDGKSGGRIFVRLYFDDGSNTGDCWSGNCPVNMRETDRHNKIILQPGTDFAVLDANATDADGALFQLPSDVSTKYQVFARELGRPGGSAKMTTCATFTIDPDGIASSGDEYQEVLCSINSYLALREKGKPTTDNVTDKLLWMQVNVTALATSDPALATCLAGHGYTGTSADVPLFDSCFQTYFWDYDNNGLKLLQLRFYPLPS